VWPSVPENLNAGREDVLPFFRAESSLMERASFAASSILSPSRLRFGSVHVGAPMKPEELRAKLRGVIAFLLWLPEILFSGFQQCKIVTFRALACIQ
jgi:hypothetical protein